MKKEKEEIVTNNLKIPSYIIIIYFILK